MQLHSFTRATALSLLTIGIVASTAYGAEHKKPAAHEHKAADHKSAGDSATPQKIGGSKGWAAYSYVDRGAKVCYLVGYPAKTDPADAAHGRIDAMVTHRPREKAVSVVNFDAGYAFKKDSSAEVEIDGHKFTFFTDQDAAWAPDTATDRKVAETLAKGRHVTVKGTTARGTAVTESYSLEGFGDALTAIDKGCKVRP